MLTTDPRPQRQGPRPAGAGAGTRVLVVAGGVALSLAAAVVAVAALVSGGSGAAGALVGAALALGVFGAGSVVVNVVTRIAPTMGLVVALMTFTLQVLLMALVFWRLSSSGLLTDGTLDRTWVGVALIVATLAWSVGQIIAMTRARIPVYDLDGAGN